jgi:hypothetical protein
MSTAVTTSKVKDASLFSALTTQLRVWIEAKKVARDAINALNQENTRAKNLFKAFMQIEGYPAKTKVVIDGAEFMWAASESEVIDPRKWHEMWKAGEITEAQYFEALRVAKEEAKVAIGEDQVATISSMKTGKSADIRFDDANAGSKAGVEIALPEMIKPRGGIKPRIVSPVQVPATSPKPRVLLLRRK